MCTCGQLARSNCSSLTHGLLPQRRHTCKTRGSAQLFTVSDGEHVYAQLRCWIASHGGFIHPALGLVDTAPSSKCRGIVAVKPITLCDLEAGPLVSVPQELQLSGTWALGLIQQHAVQEAAAAAADQLSDSHLIAAALAHELNGIASSWWRPYLQLLPQQPPSPWLLTTDQQVAASIEPYKATHGAEAVEHWPAAVKRHRQHMLEAADQVVQLLGPALGISQHQVLYALAHVASRSLSSGRNSGLVPLIDLINQGPAARAPMLQLDDNDKLVMTVLPIRDGEAVPLAAGEELLIGYQGGYTPLEAFLKFGFVADEWWPDQSGKQP